MIEFAIAVQQIAEAAAQCEKSFACPGELLAAQCALESGWLRFSPGHNCFGLKEYPGSGRQLLKSVEWLSPLERDRFLSGKPGRTAVLDPGHIAPRNGRDKYIVEDWFATFASLAECFKKRAEMFTQGVYARLAEAYAADRDFTKLVRGIAIHYATAPDYADQVLKIAGMKAVQEALSKARAAS